MLLTNACRFICEHVMSLQVLALRCVARATLIIALPFFLAASFARGPLVTMTETANYMSRPGEGERGP